MTFMWAFTLRHYSSVHCRAPYYLAFRSRLFPCSRMLATSMVTALHFISVWGSLRLSSREFCTRQTSTVARAAGEALSDVVGLDFGYGWARWAITFYLCRCLD